MGKVTLLRWGWVILAGACGNTKDSEPEDSSDGGAADGADGGSADGGDGSDGGGSDGADGSDGGVGTEVELVLGSICPVEDRLGLIQVEVGWSHSVTVTLWDKAHPWFGPPSESTEFCGFHTFDPGICGECPSGTLCSWEGSCLEEPRTNKNATLAIRADDRNYTFTADPTVGGIYGDLEALADSYTVELLFDDVVVRGEGIARPVGPISASVTFEGDSMNPGAMDATWTPVSDGSVVGTTIQINHHAGGPTYTSCLAPRSAGGFAATATMLDPLAVITGLEFQGIDHQQVAAADVPGGCIEMRVGYREM
jgi:hypothetical protein